MRSRAARARAAQVRVWVALRLAKPEVVVERGDKLGRDRHLAHDVPAPLQGAQGHHAALDLEG